MLTLHIAYLQQLATMAVMGPLLPQPMVLKVMTLTVRPMAVLLCKANPLPHPMGGPMWVALGVVRMVVQHPTPLLEMQLPHHHAHRSASRMLSLSSHVVLHCWCGCYRHTGGSGIYPSWGLQVALMTSAWCVKSYYQLKLKHML